jgi:hypothetical protein
MIYIDINAGDELQDIKLTYRYVKKHIENN